MKKRIGIILIIAIVFISGTIIFASTDIFKASKEIDGRYQVFGNQLEKIPDGYFKEEEIDPVSGIPNVENSSIYENKDDKKIASKKIELTSEKDSMKFTVEYCELEGKKKPLNNTLYGYVLTALHGDIYLLDNGFNLYSVDMNKNEIVMFVNESDDKITYNSDEYKKLIYPRWATNPILSPDHKYVLFYTTRNSDSLAGETILKNLDTNVEQKIIDGQFFFVGNGENNETYVTNNNSLFVLNYKDSTISSVTNEYMFTPIIKWPYLVYFDSDRLLQVKNLKTGDQKSISPYDTSKGKPIGTDLNKTDDIQYVLFMYYPDRTSPAITISILDPRKMTHRDFVPDDKMYLQTYGWIDESTLSLSITRVGIRTEETYLIDINNLEEKEY